MKNKDNSFRLCVDYRKINSKTDKQRFSYRVTDDIIDQLHSAKIFTTLHLKNAFFHVEVIENSKKYTSFVTHSGQFEFLCMNYVLSDVALAVHRYIQSIFRDLINKKGLIVYMDDFIIPTKKESRLRKLQRVLTTASEYGLELNPKKATFYDYILIFFGYDMTRNQLHPPHLKTKDILNFPEPSVKGI